MQHTKFWRNWPIGLTPHQPANKFLPKTGITILVSIAGPFNTITHCVHGFLKFQTAITSFSARSVSRCVSTPQSSHQTLNIPRTALPPQNGHGFNFGFTSASASKWIDMLRRTSAILCGLLAYNTCIPHF